RSGAGRRRVPRARFPERSPLLAPGCVVPLTSFERVVMQRTRLRAALLLVVGAALLGIGYLVSRNVVAHRGNPLAELGADFLPQVAQRIQNFRRVKVEHGRMVWEINAKDAQFFEAENQIVVVEPKVTFFMKEEGRQAHLRGNEGRITLAGHELGA